MLRDTHDRSPEVLVVGAGPVGLVAALELVRRGRRVRIVDAAPGPASSSRALGSHARSLEVYDQLGVREAITARARPVAGLTVHQAGRELARLDLDLSPTPTPITSSWFVAQTDIEAVLREALASAGDATGVPAPIEWSTRLTAIENLDDGVAVALETPHGRERVAASYVVGADGGHSGVRKELGLDFVGGQLETWLVADAELEGDLPDDSIHLLRSAGGSVMAFPFPEAGRWRLLDTTGTGGDRDVLAARFTAKLTGALRRPVRVTRIGWYSAFTIQQRQVPTLSVGGVFLAGDAAHVHSPASGQGLNTGIQDAHNLAWKLDAVLTGADPALLASYDRERRPVSARLLRSAGAATRLVQGGGLLGALTRPALALVANVPPLRRRASQEAARSFSALTIDYTDSPLTTPDDPTNTRGRAGAEAPRPGQRITRLTAAQAGTPDGRSLFDALRRPGHVLIDLTPEGDLAGDADRPVSYLGLPQRPGATSTSPDDGGLPAWARVADWYLVRPDGYLAARGRARDGEHLARALTRATGRPTRDHPRSVTGVR